MRPSKTIKFLSICLMLSGCVDYSPTKIQAELNTEDDDTVAAWYYSAGPKNWYGEAAHNTLTARHSISSDQWPDIDQHIISIGMGAPAVIASWGRPYDVNSTTTATGNDDQWVYRPCDTCKMSFVYFRNGAVYSIQN